MRIAFALICLPLVVSCASTPRPTVPPDLTINTYRLQAGYPQTQQGASRANLATERRSIDDRIQLEVIGSIPSDRFGALNIYRYHSAYSGERYFVFVVHGPTVHCIELSSSTRLNTDTCAHRIQERLKSLRTNDA